jgi:hypothetical protein
MSTSDLEVSGRSRTITELLPEKFFQFENIANLIFIFVEKAEQPAVKIG